MTRPAIPVMFSMATMIRSMSGRVRCDPDCQAAVHRSERVNGEVDTAGALSGGFTAARNRNCLFDHKIGFHPINAVLSKNASGFQRQRQGRIRTLYRAWKFGVSSAGITGGTATPDRWQRSRRLATNTELRDQLDKLADDASFNGINLLRGDNLRITFNETGTSELDIRSKDAQGINSGVLDLISNLDPSQLDDDADIDTLLDSVKSAINDLRSQSSAFGSSLSIVQNRQDFSKNMINTLQTGASI